MLSEGLLGESVKQGKTNKDGKLLRVKNNVFFFLSNQVRLVFFNTFNCADSSQSATELIKKG